MTGSVLHIVLFRYRDGTTEEQRAEVSRRFLALADSERDGARYIRSIRGGAQRSPQGAGQGFDVAFVVEFASLEDRDYYLGGPSAGAGAFDEAHAAFSGFVAPLLAPDGGLLVFDVVSGLEG